MNENRSVSIGDVFRLSTSKGDCYGQVINTNKKWKYVVAIFRRFFQDDPNDLNEVLQEQPQIITTFLAQDAVNQSLISIVDNFPVASKLRQFPTFRATNNLKGDDTMWFFWDGEKEWKVHRPLTNEEKRYPVGPSFPSVPLLIERIENDFRVEKDFV